jgi:hypothetical protein
MSKFKTLDTEAPAEMGDVVEAVVRLGTFSERELSDLVSSRACRLSRPPASLAAKII